ncbi:hypothetical protein ABBQ32_001722 [Trebouxia sp. C0010 RCD-2024]
MLLPLHCSPDTDRAAPTLPTALAPVRPLLQLTQVLLSQKTYDATHTKLTPSATASSTQTDSAQQDKSCKADPAKTTTEDYIALLQTALLTLKLISLLSAVSPQTSSTTAASTVLWASLAGTATTIAEAQSAQGQMSRPWNPPRPPEALSGTVVAVIKLLMSELRRGLVKDGMSSNASMCCRILAALLGLSLTKNAYCSEKTIADAITHPASGGLAVLVAGLKLCKGETAPHDAMAIAKLMKRLCSDKCVGPWAQQHVTMLARMQTAIHLSCLLCPELDEKNEDRKAQALCLFESQWVKTAAADAADAQQLRDLEGVVDLIHQLLTAASSPLCWSYMSRLDLPQSEAAALWETRQTIALRALFLLEFLQARLTPGAPNTDVVARMPDGHHSSPSVLIFRTLLQCLAGHLLDLRLDVRALFAHGFNAVMYAWAQWAGASAPDQLRDVGTLMLQRLVSQYPVLLCGKHAGLSTSDKRARPLRVAAIWTLIVECHRADQLQTAVEAIEALHTLVCHTTYSQQLIHLPMNDIFKPLLQALQPFPLSTQLTFGASLACLAAQAHAECQDLPKSALKEPRARLAICHSIQHNATLELICSCIVSALTVPMPWSTEHTVSLARALHRAAHLCKQQPHLVTPMIKKTQAHVLLCLLELAGPIQQVDLQRHILIGALLLSGLPYKKPFPQDPSASQNVHSCSHE